MVNGIDLTDPNFQTELMQIGVTGTFTYGPLGTELPTGLQPYETPFVNGGWISDEGLTESIAEEVASFTPWQSKGAVKESASTREFTFNFTLWTIGGLANALRYGVSSDEMEWDEEEQTVTFDQGGEDQIEIPRFFSNFDILDGPKHRRFILPESSRIEPSDVTYNKGALIGYPMTVKANLSNEHGFSIRRIFKEGWKPGTSGSLLAGSQASKSLGDWSTPVEASSTNP